MLGLAEVGLASVWGRRDMSLPLLLDAFERTPAAATSSTRLPGSGRRRSISADCRDRAGPCSRPRWCASSPQRLMAVVAPTPADAERWLSDLQFLSDEPVALYPQREALGEDEPHYEIAGERVETIEALLGGRLRILVTTARAIAERTLVPASLEKRRIRLAKGTRIRPQVLVQDLEAMGFRRVTTVTEVAEFSARGGIVDVYGFGMASATRLEWWDDEVSSLRAFDLTTQRSGAELDEVTVLPIKAVEVGEAGTAGERTRATCAGPCSTCCPPTRCSCSTRPGRSTTRSSAPGARRPITSRSRAGWARTSRSARRFSRRRRRCARG